MYTVIQDKVSIKNDYKGAQTIGFLKKDEVIYPVKILEEWAMFIFGKRYGWVRMHDSNMHYIMNIDEKAIKGINRMGFRTIVLTPYINSKT